MSLWCLADGIGHERQQCQVPCPLDGLDELALVFGAGARDALGDDLPLLAHEPLELLLVLVVDVDFLGVAEAARPFLAGGLVVAFAAGLAESAVLPAEAVRLQEAYLRAGIVGNKWADDALHVAFAAISRCSLLVSWNFKHIVHYDKIALYNAINVVEGYGEIGIHSPEEVIEYESEDV